MSRKVRLVARNEASTELDGGRKLVLGIVLQAFIDLADPDAGERADAALFLTETLWAADPEGLPLRALHPAFFTKANEGAIRDRAAAIIAGTEEPPEWDDDLFA